jgi:hypothetical protein
MAAATMMSESRGMLIISRDLPRSRPVVQQLGIFNGRGGEKSFAGEAARRPQPLKSASDSDRRGEHGCRPVTNARRFIVACPVAITGLTCRESIEPSRAAPAR